MKNFFKYHSWVLIFSAFFLMSFYQSFKTIPYLNTRETKITDSLQLTGTWLTAADIGGDAVGSQIHDSLVMFDILNSANNRFIFPASGPAVFSGDVFDTILKVRGGIVGPPYTDCFYIYADGTSGGIIELLQNPFIIRTNGGGFDQIRIETDHVQLDDIEMKSHATSMTDGTPTATELGNAGLPSTGNTFAIVLDTDGAGGKYIVLFDGSTYYYLQLTVAL